MTLRWRDLTPKQQKALAKIIKDNGASSYECGVSIATFRALEHRKLIRVETTLGSIAFPQNAMARATDAGRALCSNGESLAKEPTK